jgi:hypothetical protein
MSNVAVILTSERCGHCRNMRGTGRLMSKTEIKKENKQPNIPVGHHYDATWIRKLITADLNKDAKLRVINLHYKSFNPAEGMMDISVFTLENDKEVRQTMLKETSGGKTNMTIYVVGESGRVLSNQDIDTSWVEMCKTYVPVNIGMYAYFFPSLLLFEGNEWTESIKNKTPIYGYMNGFDTKKDMPYGALTGPGIQPNVLEFNKFLAQFFNGTKELKGKPPVEDKPVEPEPVKKEPIVVPAVRNESSGTKIIPTTGTRRNFRLYVLEK